MRGDMTTPGRHIAVEKCLSVIHRSADSVLIAHCRIYAPENVSRSRSPPAVLQGGGTVFRESVFGPRSPIGVVAQDAYC